MNALKQRAQAVLNDRLIDPQSRAIIRYPLETNTDLSHSEKIEKTIYLIRGEKVMLDRDLALLYAVETKVLNRAVKRNPQRFPSDFMFQLTAEEADSLRCQNWHLKTKAEVVGVTFHTFFTEQGVAMLSPARDRKEIGFRSGSEKK